MFALARVKRRIVQGHWISHGSLYDCWGTSAPFRSKPKLSISYTAEETSIEIVGITELVKCADSLVPATIVTMLLCLAHSSISRITFGQNWQAKRLVTLLLHMRKAWQSWIRCLLLHCSKFCYKWYDVKLVYSFTFFSCAL